MKKSLEPLGVKERLGMRPWFFFMPFSKDRAAASTEAEKRSLPRRYGTLVESAEVWASYKERDTIL